MALLRPLYMAPAGADAAITYSAQQDRAIFSAIFSREGVQDFDANHLRVTQRGAGANFSVDVAAGFAAIFGDDVANQGTYSVQSDATANISTFSTGGAITAPGSGTRYHRVIARVRDKFHNGTWTTYDWVIQILQDTGTGLPALPATAISLAQIAISAGQASIQNAHITDLRPRASVGTQDRSGLITVQLPNWQAEDGVRPPRYRVNPDGWVQLAGFVRYKGGTFAITNTQFYGLVTAADVPSAIKPSSFRDTIVPSSMGPLQLTYDPNDQTIKFWSWQNTNLVQNNSWISLDGAGWLL